MRSARSFSAVSRIRSLIGLADLNSATLRSHVELRYVGEFCQALQGSLVRVLLPVPLICPSCCRDDVAAAGMILRKASLASN